MDRVHREIADNYIYIFKNENMNEEEHTYDEYFEMREPDDDDDDERMYVPRADLLNRTETDK